MYKNNTTSRHNYRQDTSPQDNGIRRLFSVLWQHKKRLFIITILGFFLTLGFSTFFITTNYTASSSILIDNNYQRSNMNALEKSFPLNVALIPTEMEILKSRNLAIKTVKRLHLMNDPEFNTALNQGEDILDVQVTKNMPSSSNNIENSDTITNFLKSLHVSAIPNSLAVKINFTSQNAEKAALITNTLVNEYTKQRTNEKYTKQLKLITWFDKRIRALRDQVLQAELKAAQYRAKHNLSIGQRDLLPQEQLAALHSQRILAQTNYLDIKSQLDHANHSVNKRLIKNLTARKSAIKKNISDLSNRYGPKHPVMIEKQIELEEINNKINREKKGSKKHLHDGLRLAKDQLNEIEETIKTATEQSNIDKSAMAQWRNLKKEAATSRKTLKTFLEKYKHASNKNIIPDTGTRVISYADVPTTPSSPDRKFLLALGTLASFIIGLVFIFLHEKLYNKFRNPKDLEEAFALPCLGSIPFIRVEKHQNLIKHVLSNPPSPITESLHNLRISLKNQKSKTDSAPQVISVLSSLESEGKTTISMLISALAAKAGERVMLIDTNLRTPSIHEALSQNNHDNLVDYLTDQKNLEDIIYKDPDTGLHVIFGSAVPNNAFNLLSLNKLDALIKSLRKDYDLVILDTPSCLTASDARLVEQLSDFNLFSVKQNATKDEIVAQSVRCFQNHKNPALGFVLTHVKK